MACVNILRRAVESIRDNQVAEAATYRRALWEVEMIGLNGFLGPDEPLEDLASASVAAATGAGASDRVVDLGANNRAVRNVPTGTVLSSGVAGRRHSPPADSSSYEYGDGDVIYRRKK